MNEKHENQGILKIKKICKNSPLELYRLVIDGYRQDTGCVTQWENREKGSLCGVLNGFNEVINEIENNNQLKPDASFLKKLHSVCTQEVERLNQSKNAILGDFRNQGARYGMGDSNNPMFGTDIKKDLSNPVSAKQQRTKDYFTLKENGDIYHEGFVSKESQENNNIQEKINERVNLIFQEYNENISKRSLSDDEKLGYIVDCIQELEWVHPFGDANCRTICVLLLNALLISQNLSPTILVNPNYFDFSSKESLIKDIKNGQKDFGNLVNNKNEFSFDMHILSQLFSGAGKQKIGEYSQEEKNNLIECVKKSNLYKQHGENSIIPLEQESLARKKLSDSYLKKLDDIKIIQDNVSMSITLSMTEKNFMTRFCNDLKDTIQKNLKNIDSYNSTELAQIDIEQKIELFLDNMLEQSKKISITDGFRGFINNIFEKLGWEKPFNITDSLLIDKVGQFKENMKIVKENEQDNNAQDAFTLDQK